MLVHTNSDGTVVRREGVKFRDSGSKIERNIVKHQICHTLPERSVGTSLWRPKIFIMIKIYDSLYSNFTPAVAYYLWYLVNRNPDIVVEMTLHVGIK